MIIDNFDLILPLLTFSKADSVYLCQIVGRRKENPELGRNAVKYRDVFITSVTDIEKVKDTVKRWCSLFNARAYINLNEKSGTKAALAAAAETVRRVGETGFMKGGERIYVSCLSKSPSAGAKRWVVDVDTLDDRELAAAEERIRAAAPEGDKIKAMVRTPGGYHLVTSPFNLMDFGTEPYYAVLKNNMVLLYADVTKKEG
jgi:hypothetical protein